MLILIEVAIISSIFLFFSTEALFPEGKFGSRILLAVTDAAPYMVLAMKNLAPFFPKMVHLTCLVHLLHNLCQQITELYELVNKWIALIKKVHNKDRDIITGNLYFI